MFNRRNNYAYQKTGGRKVDFKKAIFGIIRTFAISLLVTIGVTFIWNLVFHGAAKVDWETSFRFAILLGIILPIASSRNRRE